MLIRDHAVLGSGPDSFNTLYTPTSPDSSALKALDGAPFLAASSPHLSHPHNILLDFWMSTGLLGIAALCWILAEFELIARQVCRLCVPLRKALVIQRLLLGMVGSIVATVVHGLVDSAYFVPDLAMISWLFIGLLLVVQAVARREQQKLWPAKTAMPTDTPANASTVQRTFSRQQL